MGRDPLKVQERNGVEVGRFDESLNPVREFVIVLQRLHARNPIARGDLFGGVFGRGPFDEVVGVLGRGGVEVQDG